jgi:hypothetical protein
MSAGLWQDLQLDQNVFSHSASQAPPTRSAPTPTQMMDVPGAPPRPIGGEGTSGEEDIMVPVQVRAQQRSPLITTDMTTTVMGDWSILILSVWRT